MQEEFGSISLPLGRRSAPHARPRVACRSACVPVHDRPQLPLQRCKDMTPQHRLLQTECVSFKAYCCAFSAWPVAPVARAAEEARSWDRTAGNPLAGAAAAVRDGGDGVAGREGRAAAAATAAGDGVAACAPPPLLVWWPAASLPLPLTPPPPPPGAGREVKDVMVLCGALPPPRRGSRSLLAVRRWLLLPSPLESTLEGRDAGG